MSFYVFTHPVFHLLKSLDCNSYRFRSPPVNSDYQRLEFLGDAVLGWMVTAHLYFASSAFTPAELTRIKVQVHLCCMFTLPVSYIHSSVRCHVDDDDDGDAVC